jgi:hypothetical protein
MQSGGAHSLQHPPARPVRARARSAWLRRIVTAASLLLALAASGCAGRNGGSTSPTTSAPSASDVTAATTTVAAAAAVVPPVTGEAVHYSTLEVGQCFVVQTTVVKGVSSRVYQRVPCDGPHVGEIYDRTSYPAVKVQPYPGDAAMRKWAIAYCYTRFADFVGVSYERSAYGIDVFTPNEENFTNAAARYRGVSCYVAPGGAGSGQLVGSAKNTRM